MPQALSHRKENLCQGALAVGVGVRGLIKVTFPSEAWKLPAVLWPMSGLNRGMGKRRPWFCPGALAELCTFYTLPRLFSVYVRYFRKRWKSSPSVLCIRFFCFSPSSPPPSPALPVLCLRCPAQSSGETEVPRSADPVALPCLRRLRFSNSTVASKMIF